MHYDKNYFEWQRQIGNLGGKLDKFKFEPYVSADDTVVDFGCGGGFILKNLSCKRRIGIDVNQTAREYAASENGIEVFSCADELPDNVADIIISNHALEHVDSPLDILKALYPKLKDGGKIVFVVPLERKKKYEEDDINMHLFTWCEQNLGNLFKVAGYKVVSVEELFHRWPRHYEKLYKIFGLKFVSFVASVYAHVHRNLSQIRVVATKER